MTRKERKEMTERETRIETLHERHLRNLRSVDVQLSRFRSDVVTGYCMLSLRGCRWLEEYVVLPMF
jgi:hypothetical protein